MKSQIAAFIERALPRGFSAGLMLLLALLTSPGLVGVYAYVILLYTAIQAATDMAARQVLMRALREPEGPAFLRQYRRTVPVFASLSLLALILFLRQRGVVDSWALAAQLLPLALAPIPMALGLASVGKLQAAGRWHVTARVQLVATLGSFAITLPLLLLTRSLVAPALQALLAEILVATLCYRAARDIHLEPIPPAPGSRSLRADMVTMSILALAAWSQGQAERVFFGIFIGPRELGTYTTASAIARAPGDALAASTGNVLRSQLATVHSAHDIRAIAETTLKKALFLAGAGFLAAVALSVGLRFVMDPQWDKSLDIVPVLALSAFPSVLSWSAAVLQLRAGKSWQTLWAPAVGIGMAVLIVFVAHTSLFLASYIVVLRDFVTVNVAFLFIRRAAPWRAYTLCWIITAVLGVIVYVVSL